MPYLNYLLTFPNGKFYVGYTKTSVKRRLTEHRSTVRNGKRSKLYNAWRKYKGILITPNRYEFRGRYFANQRQIQSMFKLAAKTVVKLVRSGEIKDASRG